jgi:apoptosis-inducing factor 2
MAVADSKKKIVILGGSYGGVSTAHYVLKHAIPKLPEPQSYQVVLVSTSSQATCRPAAPRAMISDDMFDQAKLFVSIPDGFAQYPAGSFVFQQGTATVLDHENRTVTVQLAGAKSGEELNIAYHALVIATGASTHSPLLGYTSDEKALKASWAAFRGALGSAKHIVIAGGGASGVEAAGELGEHLNGRAGWFSSSLSNPKVRITLLSGGSRILPYLRENIAATAETYLAKVGVRVVHNARVTSVGPETAGTTIADVAAKATLKLDNGDTLQADLYIPAVGATPNTQFVSPALRTADGRVNTDSGTMRVVGAGDRVYAIGDVTSAARPSIYLITTMVPLLGANIKRDLLLAAGSKAAAQAGEDRLFKEDMRMTQLVPIGKSKGVGAIMGMKVPSFFVWLIKGRDYWLSTTGDLWNGKQWAKES